MCPSNILTVAKLFSKHHLLDLFANILYASRLVVFTYRSEYRPVTLEYFNEAIYHLLEPFTKL